MAAMLSPKSWKARTRLVHSYNSPQYDQNQTTHKYKLPLSVKYEQAVELRSIMI
jgi:hypothetical protein